MPTILDEIVATKRAEVAKAKDRRPLAELEAVLESAPPARSFFDALAANAESVSLIAEWID